MTIAQCESIYPAGFLEKFHENFFLCCDSMQDLIINGFRSIRLKNVIRITLLIQFIDHSYKLLDHNIKQ